MTKERRRPFTIQFIFVWRQNLKRLKQPTHLLEVQLLSSDYNSLKCITEFLCVTPNVVPHKIEYAIPNTLEIGIRTRCGMHHSIFI